MSLENIPDLKNSLKSITIAIAAFVAFILIFASYYVVQPGNRAVLVTLGKVSPAFAPEGLGFKMPLITRSCPFQFVSKQGQFGRNATLRTCNKLP
jgi:uncharacterized membrane protein YqiK